MAGRYITQGRMRRSKWEDAMANRRLKSDFEGKKHAIVHTNCLCGSMECLAVPCIITRRFDAKDNEKSTEQLTPEQAVKTLKKRKRQLKSKSISQKEYEKIRYQLKSNGS